MVDILIKFNTALSGALGILAALGIPKRGPLLGRFPFITRGLAVVGTFSGIYSPLAYGNLPFWVWPLLTVCSVVLLLAMSERVFYARRHSDQQPRPMLCGFWLTTEGRRRYAISRDMSVVLRDSDQLVGKLWSPASLVCSQSGVALALAAFTFGATGAIVGAVLQIQYYAVSEKDASLAGDGKSLDDKAKRLASKTKQLEAILEPPLADQRYWWITEDDKSTIKDTVRSSLALLRQVTSVYDALEQPRPDLSGVAIDPIPDLPEPWIDFESGGPFPSPDLSEVGLIVAGSMKDGIFGGHFLTARWEDSTLGKGSKTIFIRQDNSFRDTIGTTPDFIKRYNIGKLGIKIILLDKQDPPQILVEYQFPRKL